MRRCLVLFCLFLIIFGWVVLSNKEEKGEAKTAEAIIKNLIEIPKNLAFLRYFEKDSEPAVISTNPVNGSKAVPVYLPVIINFNQDMKEVRVIISRMAGDVEIRGRTATYKPHTVFMPGKTYEVTVCGKTVSGKKMEPYSFNFCTADMKDKLWVEVNLRLFQKVVVYQGDRAIRSMLASAGVPEPENATPQGFFTIKNRGESFWSEKFKEGALYWVRIKDDYLFHSMPRDAEGNIMREDFAKLGLPASHGCIRLKDEDAKWFYENVPDGTMVVIHE